MHTEATKRKPGRPRKADVTTTAAVPPATRDIGQIALGLVVETCNYRTRQDDRAFGDLKESMRLHGQLQPVMLSLTGDGKTEERGYEVVFGHQRIRAARELGWETILADVRELEHWQILELQLVENDQRSDPDPIDQAVRFKELVESGRYGAGMEAIRELAAKLGRTTRYVAGRLWLNQLSLELQHKVSSGEMPLSAAQIVSRWSPKMQAEVPEHCLETETSVRNYERQRSVLLEKAPFSLERAGLAGEPNCSNCPKRSGVTANLFGDAEDGDRCLDRACFQAKLGAHAQECWESAHALTTGVVVKISKTYEGAKGDVLPAWHSKFNLSEVPVPGVSAPVVVMVSNDPAEVGKVLWHTPKPKLQVTSGGAADLTPEQEAMRERTKWLHEVRKRNYATLKDAMQEYPSLERVLVLADAVADYVACGELDGTLAVLARHGVWPEGKELDTDRPVVEWLTEIDKALAEAGETVQRAVAIELTVDKWHSCWAMPEALGLAAVLGVTLESEEDGND